MQKANKVAIIGYGVMGSVLLKAIRASGISKSILVCDSDEKKKHRVSSLKDVSFSTDINKCSDADVIFLAIKPQDFQKIVLSPKKHSLVCSIMAGVPMKMIKEKLGVKNIVRAMPNTPATHGVGMTAWVSSQGASEKEKGLLKKVFNEMGEEIEVSTENMIDKATAISGSGPAYIFHVAFAFIKAAQSLGVSKKDSQKLVIQTLKGAAMLVSENEDIEELIKRVASKGGTTEAALKIFEKEKEKSTWKKAVRAAYQRAKEISKDS
ncbi:MAG: pyrroline-5-carboxylate reductase [Candidatus Harrisonbacteria bacterium CG10_big_fil_rev_8_21_14_0_10_49_15]|uniref:Pyrroline-5-carboxylate reductase n=1 Tax=Candidatus Harrisonbacteria bacterium CG10_big_fil_rev_8_21_14_0_10_49_15 TaxID=1974587 RepID=A0A2H0ULU7_9BACT|nr:MAG: pyrroline-5-carboxylate reductase [Candidatus Harrisonbacteria bacterium CG10_big_fil_rev_8_21_14_0_10_49_15]